MCSNTTFLSCHCHLNHGITTRPSKYCNKQSTFVTSIAATASWNVQRKSICIRSGGSSPPSGYITCRPIRNRLSPEIVYLPLLFTAGLMVFVFASASYHRYVLRAICKLFKRILIASNAIMRWNSVEFIFVQLCLMVFNRDLLLAFFGPSHSKLVGV